MVLMVYYSIITGMILLYYNPYFLQFLETQEFLETDNSILLGYTQNDSLQPNEPLYGSTNCR